MSSGFKYWNVVLTDIDGTSAIVQDSGTDDNHGVYKIASAPAGLNYFYIDWNGTASMKLENYALRTASGGTLKAEIQWKIGGSWVDGGLADSYETDANLDLSATQAAKWNTVDINRPMYGVPCRIACLTDAAGDLFAQALRS